MTSPLGLTEIPDPADSSESDAPAAQVAGLSQGRIVLKRFLDHRAAVVSLIVFVLIVLLAVTSIGVGPIPGWWKWDYNDTPNVVNLGHPTFSLSPFHLGTHPFGQDSIGRDEFAIVMRGSQISIMIMLVVGIVAAAIGIVIGALAGFFRGWTEAILMRFTDVMIIIPPLIAAAVVATLSHRFGGVLFLAVFLGIVSWTGMARLVRGDFLTLREREFVDAARLAGASNGRIIFKHILPNAVGVITVNTTLLMSAAILLETALSYVGLGVQPPDVSLGLIVSQNQAAFATRPWLFWWPGIFIVVICLTVNFVGDGLRDAFDPRQRKFKMSRKDRQAQDEPMSLLDVSSALDDAYDGTSEEASGSDRKPDEP